MKVYFHILNGTREGQILELEVPAGQTMTIGRDPTCDLAFSLEFEYPVEIAMRLARVADVGVRNSLLYMQANIPRIEFDGASYRCN